jgi:hypothetical protein
MWAGGSAVPDAWRFDPAGCQGGRLTLAQPAPTGACLPLRGTHPTELSQVDYIAFPPGAWSGGKQIIRFLAQFDPMVADPTKTYTIARFVFDHSNSVLGSTSAADACGCQERPLCISLAQAIYEDGDGVERSFSIASSSIHWNDPANSLICPYGPDLCDPDCGWYGDTTCVATPTAAERQTWGRVKASYR